MDLSVSHHEGYVVATITGPIEQKSAEALFREYLHPLVGQPGTKLIIDLGDSVRLTSAGLTQLVMLVADANTKGSQVILIRVGPLVANVLRVTKLDGFLEVADSLSEAIERFNAPG